MLPKVTIFGRPNVGKSTLFNRIAKRKAAIVENISGVTRDSVSLRIVRNELEFILYDSAGFYASNHKKKLPEQYRSLSYFIETVDFIWWTGTVEKSRTRKLSFKFSMNN